jgi:hypothetical protein
VLISAMLVRVFVVSLGRREGGSAVVFVGKEVVERKGSSRVEKRSRKRREGKKRGGEEKGRILVSRVEIALCRSPFPRVVSMLVVIDGEVEAGGLVGKTGGGG